jgi:two-component system response regulator WspF
VHALGRDVERGRGADLASAADAGSAAAPHTLPPLIAIGASTGGPHALATILAGLPADLPAAVAVVQHIDRVFAPGLARWLARRTALSVAPLIAAESLRAAHIWVAAGDGHLVLGDDLRLALADAPRDTLHRPSIDVFLASVARRVPGRALGVLLTGMGRDGAAGLLAMRQAGHPTIAQDEGSSIVYGMPKAAADLGAATEVLPLDRIAPRLVELVKSIR